MYISFGDKIPSFSLRIESTLSGQFGSWNGTRGINLRKKLVGGGSSRGDGSAIVLLLLCEGLGLYQRDPFSVSWSILDHNCREKFQIL